MSSYKKAAASKPEFPKQEIGNVLGIPLELESKWDIIDWYPRTEDYELVLCHYNDEFDPDVRANAPLLGIRGVIVDVKTKRVVCRSFGHTSKLEVYTPLGEDEQNIIVHDTKVTTYATNDPLQTPAYTMGILLLPKDSTMLYLGNESLVVRFFKYKGKVFFSTYKRIDGTKSTWGGRQNFWEMFKDVTPGFNPESLFGDEENSPYTYVFLVNHKSVRLISTVMENRAIFLNVLKTWNEKDYPELVSGDIVPKGIPSADFPEPGVFENQINKPWRAQISVDVQTANKYLFPSDLATPVPEDVSALPGEMFVEYSQHENRINDIWYKKIPMGNTFEKLSGGDPIMVYVKDQEIGIRVYELFPTSVSFRNEVTAHNPNLYNNFILQMKDYIEMDVNQLKELFPLYTYEGKLLDPKKANDRRIWWWSVLYDCVSPDFKNEVNEFMARYNKDLNELINFILSSGWKNIPEEKSAEVNKTIKRFQQLNEEVKLQKQKSREYLLHTLWHEYGQSLYKLITDMKKIKLIKNSDV